MTDLSRVVAVIPVRSLAGSKSRLGEPLDQEEREALVLGLVRTTIAAAVEARCVSEVVVVSPDDELLGAIAGPGSTPLRQTGTGLNEALVEAVGACCADASGLLVLPADLPRVDAAEIDRLVRVAGRALEPDRPLVALIPDRHGTGTNALLVAPPDAIRFCFGEGSRRAHAAEAARAGGVYLEMDGPLTFDLDTPEDLLLADLTGLGHEVGR